MNLTPLNATAELILTAGAVLAVLGGWWKVVRPRWKASREKFTAAVDSIVGRPAVVDASSGRELAPALPGIGVRMAQQEQQMELLTSTVAKLVDQEAAINELRLDMSQVKKDVAVLQAGAVERVASKVEQAEMWKAVQRIQDEEPPLDADEEQS